MQDDENFSFTHLHMDEKLQTWGRFDLIVQKFQALLPVAHEEEAQKKIWDLR
jgi:predicted secreted protein